MTCLNPYFARRSLTPNKNGKFELAEFIPYRDLAGKTLEFAKSDLAANTAVIVPCGQCMGCRLDKANDWAIRCVHEAKLHLQNSFITLTYNPECLPADLSLHRDHLQLFLKRLRRYLDYHDNIKIRFLCCGEYGSLNFRPHYHILCFGWFPRDVRRLKTVASGYTLFRSPLLEELWPYGYNVVGAVTFESARYVAKYSLKKQTGKNSIMYDSLGISPEFVGSSLKPGIGADYFEKYSEDIFTLGFVTMNGVKYKIPRYYQTLFERSNPVWYDIYKQNKIENAKCRPIDAKRLAAREKILKHRQEQFERDFDNLGF